MTSFVAIGSCTTSLLVPTGLFITTYSRYTKQKGPLHNLFSRYEGVLFALLELLDLFYFFDAYIDIFPIILNG